jgi:hypothetical protein
MNCALCASSNQMEFPAEINIHLRGLKKVGKPLVFVFPNLLVCLDCGFTQVTLPEGDLCLLRESIAA